MPDQSRFADALSRLADRFGESPPPAPARREPRALGDVTGRFLLAADNPGLLAALERRLASTDGVPEAELRARFEKHFGLHVVAWATGRDDARETAVRLAKQRSDLEPVFLEPLDRTATTAAWRAAKDRGLVRIADESRSAFRLRDGLVHPTLDLDENPTLVVLGESVAAGLPFGVVLAPEPSEPSGTPPSPTVATVAIAMLERLDAGGAAERLAKIGERLRARFQAACEREDIDARLTGPAAAMRIEFAGQENAEAPLLLHHFGLELERIGVAPIGGGDVLLHPDLDLDFLVEAVDRGIARMRCLLIEHNSYMCGEIPYPFPNGDPTVVERGMALYRFPKLGEVDLISDPAAQSFRIRFLGGEIGEVTSSGFYLPTLFTGDFEISCRYAIEGWEPGPDSACLALFAQNLASSARYYAQHMSSGDAPEEHRVLGVLGGVVGEPIQVGSARAGQLRVRRRGAEITTWHRPDDSTPWTCTATDERGTTDDVVFGAKIWSKIRCGRLEATLHELAIDAALAAEQIARLEHRPDPRGLATR